MGLAKITTIFPFKNGLPRDVAEVTFWHEIAGTEATDTEYGNIEGASYDFWFNTPTGFSHPLSYWLARYIDPTKFGFRMASVNQGTGHEIGFPINVPSTGHTFGNTTGAAASYPAEVALCMSLVGDPTSALPKRRRQGRVYLGPWDADVYHEEASNDEYPRPIPTLMQTIIAQGERLVTLAKADGVPLVVYSRTAVSHTKVVQVAVDDEWDTQRRRGKKATERISSAVIAP